MNLFLFMSLPFFGKSLQFSQVQFRIHELGRMLLNEKGEAINMSQAKGIVDMLCMFPIELEVVS
mgnify:FL=1